MPDFLDATRALPKKVHPEQAVTVTLTVDAPPAMGPIRVSEAPPGGWAIVNISDGGIFSQSAGRLVWRLSGDASSPISYKIRPPPDAPVDTDFSGSVQGANGSRSIGGDQFLSVVPRDWHPPGGREVVQRVATFKKPLGISALRALSDSLKGQSLRQLVRSQNRWAERQINAYRSAPARSDYRLLLENFVEGPGGLEEVLSGVGPARPTGWARSHIRKLGTDRYAHLTAFLEGFPPGSEAFQFVFGGTRSYNPDRETIAYQGAEFETDDFISPVTAAPRSQDDTISGSTKVIRYAQAVRGAIFRLYEGFREGDLAAAGTRRFNRALVLAGGRDLIAWNVPLLTREETSGGEAGGAPGHRPILDGLDRMAHVLEDLGYPVRSKVDVETPASGADALAALDTVSEVDAEGRIGQEPRTLLPDIVVSDIEGRKGRDVNQFVPSGNEFRFPLLDLWPNVGVQSDLSISTRGHLPTAKVGEPYAHDLDIDGGSPPYVWDLVEGILPPGTKLDRERGRIVGVPQESGLFNFTLSVEGHRGAWDWQPFTLGVAEGSATILVAKTERIYDGEPKPVAIRTDPPGLDVTVTYEGTSEPPKEPGTYGVSLRVTEAGYEGMARGTLVIQESPQGDNTSKNRQENP